MVIADVVALIQGEEKRPRNRLEVCFKKELMVQACSWGV